jgi:ABC-2 type transport system ATP-binding protein
MQQRLGVARVLVHDPKVLFLDEPASGLDPRARIEMRSLLLELGRMGKTLMVSSHILSELAEMCTCIGIIERGKLLYSGSITDAFERTKKISGVSERIRVRLAEDGVPIEIARPPLENDQRVKRVVVSAETPREMIIELGDGKHGHHFVIEKLIGCGAHIDLFQPEEVKLEDAFLKLTTGALQ